MSVNGKYTKEIQAQFVSYLLFKKVDSQGVPLPGRVQKGVQIFKHFRELDQTIFEATFKVRGFTKIMELLGEYYTKYSDLPTKLTYDQLKRESKSFQNWLKNAEVIEKTELKNFEKRIFQPPQDIPYIESQILNFLAQSFAELIQREQIDAIKESSEDPYKIITQNARKIQQYIFDLKKEFEGDKDEEQDIVVDNPDLSGLRQLPGISTCFKSVTLYYRGITILVAPPKSFKTGLSQNIAVDLMLKGFHVAWIDLENGLARSIRRFYQNVLGVPKEWIYSDTYVHKDRITLEEHDPEKLYSKGDKVYRVESIPTGEKVDVFSSIAGRDITVDEYVTEIKIYEATEDTTGDYVDQWIDKYANHELPAHYFRGNPYERLTDVLKRRLQEIKEETGGQVRVRYLKNCTPDKIRSTIEDWIDDETYFFSVDGKPRIIIIDWMQHLNSNDSRLNYWEAIRDNYTQLKIIREELDLWMLGIEAMKNYEKASDPHWSLKDLKVAGTDRIQYDAEAVTVVVGTDEEKQKGYRRLIKSEDRDGPSGDNTVEYVDINYQIQRAKITDPEDHKRNCPQYWTALAEGPKKKGKNNFGQKTASNDSNDLIFPELSAEDLD